MIDKLQAWYNSSFYVNKYITIHQPTVAEIINFGEEKYWDTVYTLCAIPSDIKSVLEDMGKDYEQVDDFDCFTMLAKGIRQENSKILFGDLNLEDFGRYTRADNGELVFFNQKEKIMIDKYLYYIIVEYIRTIHYITPKVEKAANQFTKRYLIEEDRERRQLKTPFKSVLFPLISTMMSCPGFKYKKSELNQVGIMEFMDSVQRYQVIDMAATLKQGIYSGTIDGKKIKDKELNQFREIENGVSAGASIKIQG